MNPQQTSVLTQLGYLGTSPQSNNSFQSVGFSGSPSGISSAQSGFNIATEPINLPISMTPIGTYEFPVTELSLTPGSMLVGPLQSLVQTNTPPTYTTLDSDPRSDEI